MSNKTSTLNADIIRWVTFSFIVVTMFFSAAGWFTQYQININALQNHTQLIKDVQFRMDKIEISLLNIQEKVDSFESTEGK